MLRDAGGEIIVACIDLQWLDRHRLSNKYDR